MISASAATRSGCSSAKRSAVCAPIEAPASTARSHAGRVEHRAEVRGQARVAVGRAGRAPASSARARARRRRARGAPRAAARASPSPRSGASRSGRAAARSPGPAPDSSPASVTPSSALDASARARQACTAACARTSSAERCGRSQKNRWPTPSKISRRAPGISEATSLAVLRPAAPDRRCRGSRASASSIRPGARGVVRGDRRALRFDHRNATPSAARRSRRKRAQACSSAANAGETLTSQDARSARSRSPDCRASHEALGDLARRCARCPARRSRCSRASACATRSGSGERELLGDHPAHRDAEHVRRVEPQRVEQPGGVLRPAGRS